jgi:hypothetical protein
MATIPEQAEAASEAMEEKRSGLSLVRDVVISFTRVVEDSTELIGASVHEELARFRTELARHALALVALIAGASLLAAGLAMFVSELLDSWPLTLVLFGAASLGAGLLLSRSVAPKEDESP